MTDDMTGTLLLGNLSARKGSLSDLTLFAHLLAGAGHKVALAQALLPRGLNLTQQFEVLPFMTAPDAAISGLALLGAEQEDPALLAPLRQLDLPDAAQVLAIGQFAGVPQRAQERLGYALGRDVAALDLSRAPLLCAGKSACPCPGLAQDLPVAPVLRGEPPVLVVGASAAAGHWGALQNLPQVTPVIYTSSAERANWLETCPPGAQIYSYSEAMPLEIAQRARLVLVAASPWNAPRALAVVMTALASGALVVDVSAEGALAAQPLPVLRGSADPAGWAAMLPGLMQMAAQSRDTDALFAQARIGFDAFAQGTLLARKNAPGTKTAQRDTPKIHVLPTNGIGLGHAQRTSLIAAHLATPPHFFAFPSCVPMLRRFGFDATPLVSRSPLHAPRNANDLVNFARMRAGIAQGDVLLFDGGMVYSSILRVILEKRLRGVWLRRGLWKAAQDNRGPLDREKVFARVIVPREALAALEEPITPEAHIHQVGPIVQQLGPDYDPAQVRARLAARFGPFERLVVTMLGSGKVSNLTAQAQAVAAWAETRPDLLNLVMVWPSAEVPPAWYGWQRTKVVATHHAALVAGAADLFVTAVGYNSFHEALYNKVPALLVPQEATGLDDQLRRAEAAHEAGLAALLRAERVSMMERTLTRLLDGGRAEDLRAALLRAELPSPGNAAAAALIEEMCA